MIQSILLWLKKYLNHRDTKEIAKKRLEFVIIRDRNVDDEQKVKFLKRRLEPILSACTEEVVYQLYIDKEDCSELIVHIPIQHIKLSKEEENEYCVNCK